MKRGQRLDGEGEYERMLSAIAHDISLPLLQIKAKAELGVSAKSNEELKLLTQSGLKLIDSYLMALELRQNGDQLILEPVSVGSVLTDTAHELSKLAEYYDTKIEIDIVGRRIPILTNKAKLQSAFYCLGASLIRSQNAAGKKQKTVVIAAHKAADSIQAGIYGNFTNLSDKELFRARSLAGKAGQPLPSLPTGNGGGVLIADMLISSLYKPLKSSKFKEMSGYASQFPLSKQLRLV